MKAVINGLAPDKGLYFPQERVILSKDFIESIKNIDDVEICYEVMNKYVGDEIPKQKLIEIINNTISFKIPLKKDLVGYCGIDFKFLKSEFPSSVSIKVEMNDLTHVFPLFG